MGFLIGALFELIWIFIYYFFYLLWVIVFEIAKLIPTWIYLIILITVISNVLLNKRSK